MYVHHENRYLIQSLVLMHSTIIHVHVTTHFPSPSLPQSLCQQLSSLMSPGASGEPLSPLVPEERVLFGISASHPTTKTVCELSRAYSTVDTDTIAREVCAQTTYPLSIRCTFIYDVRQVHLNYMYNVHVYLLQGLSKLYVHVHVHVVAKHRPVA